MAYENNDFIWTPDESTPYDYTGNLANMASSIEQIVGRFVYEAEGTASMTDTTNFGPYSPGNVMRVTRSGRYVTLNGTWACKTAGYMNTLSNRQFGQLPVGFRPKYHFYGVNQGSGTATYMLNIGTDGKMSVARASETQGTNFWMPINVTFLAED